MLNNRFCSFLLGQERTKEGHPRGACVSPYMAFNIGSGIKHVFHSFSDIQIPYEAQSQAEFFLQEQTIC